MKTLLCSAVAAVGLALGFAPQEASAAWVTRTTYHWDAHCRRYVPCEERVWVPDRHDHHHAHREPAYYRGQDRGYERYDRSYYPEHRPFGLDIHFGLERYPYRR